MRKEIIEKAKEKGFKKYGREYHSILMKDIGNKAIGIDLVEKNITFQNNDSMDWVKFSFNDFDISKFLDALK